MEFLYYHLLSPKYGVPLLPFARDRKYKVLGPPSSWKVNSNKRNRMFLKNSIIRSLYSLQGTTQTSLNRFRFNENGSESLPPRTVN
jgi:hypothetical protein